MKFFNEVAGTTVGGNGRLFCTSDFCQCSAIAASFQVDAVYVGLLTTIPSLFLLLGIFTTGMIEKGSARNIRWSPAWSLWLFWHAAGMVSRELSRLVSFARDSWLRDRLIQSFGDSND